MEIFILLVLIVGLCQAGPVQEEVSCDDPDIFEAVARAIKELNGDRTQENKFALNVVLHAHRIAGPGKKFHVIYQVRETACPIAADKPWQNCDFLETPEGDYGNCTADIDIDSQESISQNCQFGPVVDLLPGQENVAQSLANCLGCWHPIDPKSLEVLPVVRFTIRQFNNESQQSNLYEVREVKKATRQVVNGWNYQLEYSIKETNCSKNEFLDLSPACRHLPEGQEGSCTVTAYVDNANTLVHAQHNCQLRVEEKVEPPVRVCAGCSSPIAIDSLELKEPLQIAIESFNAKNNHDFHFKIVEVKKATTQVVAGIMYRFEFIIQKTNCSKAEVEKLNEDCTAAEDGERLFCRGSVYLRPWESFNKPQITCSEHQISEALLRVPPGFTPFRSTFGVASQTEGPSGGAEFHLHPKANHAHEKKQRFRHVHKHGHGHGHRRRHKNPTESSSEEVTVLPPVETPSQLPTSKAFLEQEANSRSPHEELVGFSDVSPVHGSATDSSIFSYHLPDLPEPPKCPGTQWKPKRDPAPLDTGFSDFDLLDALVY
ncbi:kininogen-1 [Ahaetulla prasina]|uniref:kininogen-1 n=1 Tax=Ahaetulla prasina TaxID=499056 RepID=UPI0026494DC8|nr:kininogen-1 [Ahaetulla prasina]